jgi:hypothetical protein
MLIIMLRIVHGRAQVTPMRSIGSGAEDVNITGRFWLFLIERIAYTAGMRYNG